MAGTDKVYVVNLSFFTPVNHSTVYNCIPRGFAIAMFFNPVNRAVARAHHAAVHLLNQRLSELFLFGVAVQRDEIIIKRHQKFIAADQSIHQHPCEQIFAVSLPMNKRKRFLVVPCGGFRRWSFFFTRIFFAFKHELILLVQRGDELLKLLRVVIDTRPQLCHCRRFCLIVSQAIAPVIRGQLKPEHRG